MKYSRMVQSITPSLARKLFSLAKEMDDVIDLTLGDPDLMPPAKIRDAACLAIQKGQTRYSHNAGILPLRKKIAENLNKQYATSITHENCAITVGGMEAIFLSLATLIDPGDEVIIFGPYYVNYEQMIRMLGGIPIVVNTKEEDDFSIDPILAEQAVTDKTIAVIINSPCNPTGKIIPREILRALAKIADKHNLTILSDEVYKSLVFEPSKFTSTLQIPELIERTILIDSLSKKYAMTGYRLGYIVAQKEFISEIVKMQENVAACAPLPSQYAALEAFESDIANDELCATFQRRINHVCDILETIPDLSFTKPEGAFYVFINIKKSGLASLDFAMELLNREHVAVVPGLNFGIEYSKFIRIACTQPEAALREGIKRIGNFMSYCQQ